MSFRPAAAITPYRDRVPPSPPMLAIPIIDMPADDAVLPDVPVNVSMVDVASAARAVAEAAAAIEESRPPLDAATAHRDKIAARLDALELERQEIIRRRASGDEHADDAGRLALIAADTEGLRALLAQAEQAVAAPRQAVEQAQGALASAKLAFTRASDEAEEAALVAHARHLDELLLATSRRLADVQARIGRGRPLWVASETLAAAIRKLDLRRKS